MEYGQFEYDNKKSLDDFGFIITNINIGIPTPNLILESVPFMQGVYDFSAAGGETKYNTRNISITMQKAEYESRTSNLNYEYLKVVNWLCNIQTMQELKLDYVQGIFKARVESITEFSVFNDTTEITINFIAQPFRSWDYYEGHNQWDLMNFDTDRFQDVKFEVIDNDYKKEITLYNQSVTTAKPIIEVVGTVNLTFSGLDYNFTDGTYKNTIKLDKGENILKISGYGTIEFKWQRELI